MKQTERDAIEELARLLDGELPADAADAPIRRLAQVAASVMESEVVERPSPSARAALRNQLIADIEASKVTTVDRVRDAVWHRTAGVRNSARVAVASAVAAGMLGSAGVAAAAQHAIPGDVLYGVKRATESVRLTLASGLREEAQVHLAIAEERLAELRVGGLSVDETVDTLAAMDAASLAASDALIQAVTDGADVGVLADLVAFTRRQHAGLTAIYDALPTAARPFADASLEVLRRIGVEVATTMGPCGVCEQIASGADVTAVTPGDGVDGASCECLAPALPPPPREPAVSVPSSPPRPALEDGPGEDPATSPDRTAEEPDLIPSLPGPLDDLGDAVDDVLGDLVDDTGDALEVTPLPAVPDTTGSVDDDLGGLLEPAAP